MVARLDRVDDRFIFLILLFLDRVYRQARRRNG